MTFTPGSKLGPYEILEPIGAGGMGEVWKEQDVRKIGAELNVENILEGSVRRAGNRIRVTAQPVKASDGYHLWSQRFDREMTDVFAIQDEISRAIVEKLQLQLGARSCTGQAPYRGIGLQRLGMKRGI